jgi:hypothetical protein
LIAATLGLIASGMMSRRLRLSSCNSVATLRMRISVVIKMVNVMDRILEA